MNLHPLVQRQLERLKEVFPETVIVERADGSMLYTTPGRAIPTGWSRPQINVSVNLPAGYPTAKPNGFETDADLRLAGGSQPQGRSDLVLDGVTYGHFCWQPSQVWENDEHELWKRVKFALDRFTLLQ